VLATGYSCFFVFLVPLRLLLLLLGALGSSCVSTFAFLVVVACYWTDFYLPYCWELLVCFAHYKREKKPVFS